METPQINPPQKTSFWDFKNKKIYQSKKEKMIDFFIGFLFLLFLLFDGWALCFVFSVLLLGISLILELPLGIFGIWGWGLFMAVITCLFFYIFLSIKAFKKRRYFFIGSMFLLVPILIVVSYYSILIYLMN